VGLRGAEGGEGGCKIKLEVVDKETLDKEIQRAFQHYQKERLKLMFSVH